MQNAFGRVFSPTLIIATVLFLYICWIEYVFHVALYSSLTPSQGVTLNCVSTKKDVENLVNMGIIPSFEYKYTVYYSTQKGLYPSLVSEPLEESGEINWVINRTVSRWIRGGVLVGVGSDSLHFDLNSKWLR